MTALRCTFLSVVFACWIGSQAQQCGPRRYLTTCDATASASSGTCNVVNTWYTATFVIPSNQRSKCQGFEVSTITLSNFLYRNQAQNLRIRIRRGNTIRDCMLYHGGKTIISSSNYQYVTWQFYETGSDITQGFYEYDDGDYDYVPAFSSGTWACPTGDAFSKAFADERGDLQILILSKAMSTAWSSTTTWCSWSSMSATLTKGCTWCEPGYYCPGNTQSSMVLCPAGSYCIGGLAAPLPCPGGMVCPRSGSSTFSGCPVARYCPEGSMIPLACPVGYTCPRANTSTPLPCPGGYTCNTINSTTMGPRTPIGTFAPAGFPMPLPCPKGFICDQFGLIQPRSCPEGFACPVVQYPGSVSNPIPCAAGHYCPSGSHSWTQFPCPPGHACPSRTVAPGTNTTCTPGTICALPASVRALPCPAGHICPFSGTVQAVPCPRGFICPQIGMRTPVPCPARYFCPDFGMTSVQPQHLCPAGEYCPAGTIIPLPCPHGYSCKEPRVANGTQTPCPLGFYCVAGLPVRCPAGYHCDAAASRSVSGMVTPCPRGFYCPNADNNTQPVPCPIGNYCPVGSAAPQRCPPGTICAANAWQPRPCDPNTLYSRESGACVACPAGRQSYDPLADACSPCNSEDNRNPSIVSANCVNVKLEWRSTLIVTWPAVADLAVTAVELVNATYGMRLPCAKVNVIAMHAIGCTLLLYPPAAVNTAVVSQLVLKYGMQNRTLNTGFSVTLPQLGRVTGV